MDDIKYYYITKNIRQTSFDGHGFVVPVVDSDIHIVYMESSLCGVSVLKEKTMNVAGKTPVLSVKRPTGVMCKECDGLYKANSHLAWRKWEESCKTG